MKRKELEKRLTSGGAWRLRHGANHDIWVNSFGDAEAVPRHSEINEFLAKKILKNLIGGKK